MISKPQQEVIDSFGDHLDRQMANDPRDDWGYMSFSKFKTDYRLVHKIPGGLRDKVVLNIGTFFPIDEIAFARNVKKLYSVDITPKVIEFANRIVTQELSPALRERVIIEQADASALPYPDNFFDVSVSFSTLEHIPDEEKRNKSFSEIARVTKSGGYVILTVPNKLNLGKYWRSMRLQRNRTSPFGYEHYYTPGELKAIMVKHNLEPLFFASSAGDYAGVVTRIYDLLVSRFGHRMGWLGRKK